jgi:hypothetical protein
VLNILVQVPKFFDSISVLVTSKTSKLRKNILGIKIIFFQKSFFKIFSLQKYLVSYAGDVHREAFKSSCKVVVKIIQYK